MARKVCKCGRPYQKELPDGLCSICRSRSKRLDFFTGYKSEAGCGSSHLCPGHDERMQRYTERAEKQLPLFGD